MNVIQHISQSPPAHPRELCLLMRWVSVAARTQYVVVFGLLHTPDARSRLTEGRIWCKQPLWGCWGGHAAAFGVSPEFPPTDQKIRIHMPHALF